ncbi:MAG: hypothetical protein WC717_04400 [Candidatus Micrarchaeia archaeon]
MAQTYQQQTIGYLDQLDADMSYLEVYSSWRTPGAIKAIGNDMQIALTELSNRKGQMTEAEVKRVDALTSKLNGMLFGTEEPVADWSAFGGKVNTFLVNVSSNLGYINAAEAGLSSAYATFSRWNDSDFNNVKSSLTKAGKTDMGAVDFAINLVYGKNLANYANMVPGFQNNKGTLLDNYLSLLDALNSQASVDEFRSLYNSANDANLGIFISSQGNPFLSSLGSGTMGVLMAFAALDMVANDRFGSIWSISLYSTPDSIKNITSLKENWEALSTKIADYVKNPTSGLMETIEADMIELQNQASDLQILSQNDQSRSRLLSYLNKLSNTLMDPSSSTFQSDLLIATVNVNQAITDYGTGISGFNPAKDIIAFATGANLTVAGAWGVFGADSRKVYNRIYPDVSPTFGSQRATVLSSYLQYYSQVSLQSDLATRDRRMEAYASAVAKNEGLMQGNIVARFTDQMFTVNEGNISINLTGMTGVSSVFGYGQEDPVSQFLGMVREPMFQIFDPIYVPRGAFQKYYSSTPSVLLNAKYLLQGKLHEKLRKTQISDFIISQVGEEYYIDLTIASRVLNQAFRKATEGLQDQRIRSWELLGGAGKINPSFTEAGGNIGLNASGGATSTSNAGTYYIREDAGTTTQQWELLSQASNLGPVANELTNATLNEIRSNNYRSLSQDIQHDLNLIAGDKNMLVHFDRQSNASETETDVQENHSDFLHVYARASGTTWVEVFFNDEERKTITDAVNNNESLRNMFFGGGSYDLPVGAKFGVQDLRADINNYDKASQVRDEQGASAQGFFLGIGSSELGSRVNMAFAGGKDINDNYAVGAIWKPDKMTYSLRYYELDSRLISNYLGGSIGMGGGGTNMGRPNLGSQQVQDLLGEEKGPKTQFGIFEARGELESGTLLHAMALSSWSADRGFHGVNVAKDTPGGSLLRGYGFLSWEEENPGTDQAKRTVTGALFGLEGDIRPIGLEYIMQYNQNPSQKLFTMQATQDFENYTAQLTGSVTDPWTFRNWQNRWTNPQTMLPALQSAVEDYEKVMSDPNSTKEQKNAAQAEISREMNAIFQAADMYQPFMQGGVADISLKIVGKDGGMTLNLGAASIIDENGETGVRASAFVTFGDHVGALLISDPVEIQPLKNAGAGAVLSFDTWKVAAIATRTDDGGIQAQASAVFTTEVADVLVGGVVADNFYKVKVFVEGKTVSAFVIATKEDDMFSVGIKGLVEVKDGLYLLGGAGFDEFKYNGKAYDRFNVEAGVMKFSKLGKLGYGFSVRHESPTNEWMFFFDLRKTLP